jgi:hypothetical protein
MAPNLNSLSYIKFGIAPGAATTFPGTLSYAISMPTQSKNRPTGSLNMGPAIGCKLFHDSHLRAND